MCVLAFAWRAHPRWQLVVAGNRDELHTRPTAPLARWTDPDHLLAGRDLLSGGTWLGVSGQGRFAVVTNLRGHGAPRADAESRGRLLRDYLAGDGERAAAAVPTELVTDVALVGTEDDVRAQLPAWRTTAVTTVLAQTDPRALPRIAALWGDPGHDGDGGGRRDAAPA